MRLTTSIREDSASGDVALNIDKFFQFIIIGDIVDGEAEVTIYNAIAFHYKCKVTNPKIIVKFNANDEDITFNHQDCSRFYQEQVVLNQFWGKESEFSASYRELINKIPEVSGKKEELEELNVALDNAGDKDGALFITEKKDVVKDVIIAPCSIKESNGSVILNDFFTGVKNELKEHVSNGYWFKTSFKSKVENNHQGFKLKVDVKLNDANYSSSDFKVYIQTNKDYDIKQSSSSIDDKNDVSIEKVYSQNSLKYFKDWEDLGIYKSSLFRMSNGSDVDKIVSNSVNKFSASIQFEDIFASRRREVSILVFSIVLSLLCSIGLDATRQNTIEFRSLFPSLGDFSIDFLWLMSCVSLAAKYIFLKYSKIPLSLKFLLITPAVIWFGSYFLFEFKNSRYCCTDLINSGGEFCLSYLQSKLYLIDIFVSSLMLTLVGVNYKQFRIVYNTSYARRFMVWVFGR